MADLRLDVDISAVLKADKALRDFEGRFNQLEQAARRGVTSQDKLVAVFDRLDKAGISLSQVYRSMERDLDNSAKTAARLENEFRDLALSGKSARDSARAMEQAFRQQDQAAEALARSQAEVAARTLDLKRRFKEGYAASEAMQMQFRDLDEALRRGIITLEEYRQQLDRIKAGQTGFAASASNLANRMSRSSVAIQQFGYQAGDFLVQVQSGTNAFVAFGQQATQLAGLLTLSLNPKMVILGAALSILIPLGTAAAAMFARTRQEAEGAAEGVDDFDSAIKSLDSSLREWVRTKQAAELDITPEQLLGGEALSNAEEDLRSATEALARLQAAQEAIARMPMSPEGAVLALLGFGGKAGATQAEIDAAVANVEAAQERLRIIREKEEQERSAQQAEVESFIIEQTALLEDQTSLYSEIAKYGEKSAQVEEERARQARIAYQNDLMRQKVGIELLPAIMEQYEAMVKAREESEKTTRNVEAMSRVGTDSIVAQVNNLAVALNTTAENAARAVGGVRMLAMLQAEGGSGRGQGPSGAMPPRPGQFVVTPEIEAAYQEYLKSLRGGTEGGAGGGVDPLTQLQQRLELEKELLGKSEAQQRIIQALGPAWRNYSDETIQKLVELAEGIDEVNRKAAEQQKIADTIQSSMSDAFMSMVDGTKTVEDAFKDMARSIIKQLYDVLVVQQLVGSFNAQQKTGSGIVGAIGKALFRESGGSMMAGRPYIVGERGPELVIPGRSSTVTNADLTRKSMGGSDGVVVNQTINVNGGTDPAAIRMEVAKLMPTITNATKTAVIDARRRGGQMRAAFQ